MASFVLDFVGSFVLAVLGFLALIKIIKSARARKQVWDAFKEFEDESELDRREGLSISYGVPDIVGYIDDRKVYIHPVRSKKGKKPRPAKTIYAIESNIDVNKNVIISSPETTEQNPDLAELEVPTLKRYGLKVNTERYDNHKAVEHMVSKDVATMINRLFVKHGDDFRALILEPGIVMFSTFKIDIDTEQMKEKLYDTIKLVESMEDNLPESEESIQNERLEELEKTSKTVYADMVIMTLVIAASIYIIYDSLKGMSFLFVNLGMILSLLAGARLTSIVYTRGWLKS